MRKGSAPLPRLMDCYYWDDIRDFLLAKYGSRIEEGLRQFRLNLFDDGKVLIVDSTPSKDLGLSKSESVAEIWDKIVAELVSKEKRPIAVFELRYDGDQLSKSEQMDSSRAFALRDASVAAWRKRRPAEWTEAKHIEVSTSGSTPRNPDYAISSIAASLVRDGYVRGKRTKKDG